MNKISLCAGIGGLDQGTPGKTVCYVEIDPFAQAVLGARMRNGRLDSAPIWPDLKTFDGMAWRGSVDLIVAGFPCQPHSTAGRRKGADDERDLWPDVLRTIRQVGASHLYLENVAGLASPSEGRAPYAALVVGQLAEMGYDARWGIVGARDAGASHRRDRWFCLAYRNGVRPVGGVPGPIRHDGYAQRGAGEHDAPVGTDDVAYAFNDGRYRQKEDEAKQGCNEPHNRVLERGYLTDGTFPPGPSDTERWGAILAERPDLAPAVEPALRGVADGPAGGLDRHRRRRLAALGNGVVPAQAALAWALLEGTAVATAVKGGGR